MQSKPKGSEEKSRHEAFSSQPPDDPNAGDPNERSDTKEEIAHPGSHGGAGAPGRTPT